MTTISVVMVVLIALFSLVRYLEAKGVFFPSKTMNMNPSFMQLPWEDVWITTQDGVRINAWYIKNSQAKTIILFNHGNAGNISDRLLKLRFFHQLGFAVMIYDYRGFGKSEGHPTEQGVYLDAQAAFDWIKNNPQENSKRILAYGTSLGGAVAVDLATKRPVDGLVVDSSITSAKDMAKRLYPMIPSFFMAIKFDSINKVKALTMPKLFIHSPDDLVVPYTMGQALYEAAALPKQFIKIHGGHNDAQIANDNEGVKAFLAFIKENGL